MRIVIIGGGPGGYEAALVAAEHGADVTLISREGLGGNSVLWDCVPSKALIVSAEAMGWMQSAKRLGVRLEGGHDLATRTEIDMNAVMDRVQGLAFNQSADISKKVGRTGVEIIEAEARLLDPQTVEVEHRGGRSYRVSADIVLIATGSNPRTLPGCEPDGDRVFTSRELYDLRELPERLIVIGSGATGAEYAHAFARFGSEVHLISSRDQILPSEDPDAAAVIEDSFERWGMVIHRRKRAADIERGADGVRVETTEGEWVEGTHALFCIGQIPASGGLGLAAAGVHVTDRDAIPVDGVSRTNVPTVYAAGDVTGSMMLASTAAMQGRNAMWHALGQAVTPFRDDAVAKCIFTEPEVATVGMTAEDIAQSQVPVRTVSLPIARNPRAKMRELSEGFIKLHAMAGSGLVLGGAVVSAQASDLIAPVSVAVHNRLSVQQLAYAFTVYPSISGSLQEAARQLMDRA
ncbi:NAD(P)H-quinone dehydrogenase [Egibacter rhizosphaerae]|uniref:NAD(P)H-quinone dehydrogenase n=1 Tax=Egibacter rhizosphaerae TaxID=1670831 RepID=A0A411YHE0_9ACTN|nr:NAD(P)H-quinone dehydrogenase [Egibacter rhizosphaerae]QBI20643.1 NAD(P)H-quinone dehydrogenase [Egibacter rhizosphaerae]